MREDPEDLADRLRSGWRHSGRDSDEECGVRAYRWHFDRRFKMVVFHDGPREVRGPSITVVMACGNISARLYVFESELLNVVSRCSTEAPRAERNARLRLARAVLPMLEARYGEA